MKYTTFIEYCRALPRHSVKLVIALAGLVLIVGAALLALNNQWLELLKPQNTEASIQQNLLKKRGKQLRLDIDAAYADIMRRDALLKFNHIESVVARYLPSGTSFDDAEEILKAAGLDVGTRRTREEELNKNSFWADSPHRFDVVSQVKLKQSLFGHHLLVVHLVPNMPWDYSIVNSVDAYIESVGP